MRAVAAILLLASGPAWGRDSPVRIAVYHTNDIHGWFMSRIPSGSTRPLGGAAAAAALIRSDPGPKLVLDAGDWFQGTPEGGLSKGMLAVDVFNALGFDAVSVGNHEFDFTEERLKELVRSMRMPVLAANVYDARTRKRVKYLRPYILKEVAGVRVGVFGLLTTKMPKLTFTRNYAGLEFRREVDEARDMVAELRRKGAEIVIALTHIGYRGPRDAPFEDDKFLAAEVPGIDLVVGGHSHTILREPWRDPEHRTLVVQAGSYLALVGKAVLEFDPAAKRVARSQDDLLDLWADETGEAGDLAGIVAKYREGIGAKLDVIVGTATDTLTRNRTGESSLGDWMTDCTRVWARTELAFQNGGGIRSDVPAGPVTLRRLFEVMPFDNYVATVKLTGAQVRRILEHGVSGAHGMLQVSGARLRYDPGAASGRRVGPIWVGERPLEDHWIYSAAAVDFLLQGGDGYGFAEGTEPVITKTLLRDILAWCARERSPVRAAPMGRLAREKE